MTDSAAPSSGLPQEPILIFGIDIEDKLFVLKRYYQIFQDITVPRVKERWAILAVTLAVYLSRVYLLQCKLS